MEYVEQTVELPGAESWFGLDVLDAFEHAARQRRCTAQRETLEEAYVSWVHDEVMAERIGIYSPRHQRPTLLGRYDEPPLVRSDIETLITYDTVTMEVREDAPEQLVERLVDEASSYLDGLDLEP